MESHKFRVLAFLDLRFRHEMHVAICGYQSPFGNKSLALSSLKSSDQYENLVYTVQKTLDRQYRRQRLYRDCYIYCSLKTPTKPICGAKEVHRRPIHFLWTDVEYGIYSILTDLPHVVLKSATLSSKRGEQ